MSSKLTSHATVRRTVRLTMCAALLGALILAPRSADAVEGAEVLTLDRAIALATEGHPDLAAADARIAHAEARVHVAEAGRLPRVVGELGVQETNNPTLVFSNLLGQAAFTEANFAVPTLNEPDALTHWSSRLRVEQPLWTGGRLDAGIGAATAERDATSAERDRARQHVVRAVVDAWTGAVVARRAVAVHLAIVETSRRHVDLVADLHEGGLVVESDHLRTEVRLAEAEGDLAAAEARSAIADAALGRALGQPVHTVHALPDELPEPADDTPLDLAVLIDQAHARRPERVAMTQRRRAVERLADLTRAELRPRLGLGAFAEANAEDFFGADGDNWGVTIAFDLPLYAPSRRAEVSASQARVDEIDARARSLDQAIAFEVRQAVESIGAARKRLAPARRGIALADRNLTIVRDRYQNGLVVITELLDAESAVAGARLRELAAERDLQRATTALDLAIGNL
ncbi:MAG: TolC family protein [Acidobacteriota bacterium]